MFRRSAGLTVGVIACASGNFAMAADAPSILNNSDHIVGAAESALNVLGIPHDDTVGPTSLTVVVNQTCSEDPNSVRWCLSAQGYNNFLSQSQAIASATTVSQPEFAPVSTNAVTPSVPYQVINQSSANYTLSGWEQANYPTLTAGHLVYSTAYCGFPAVGDYPPVAFVTVLPNTRPASHAVSPSYDCGYAQGIEFSIPADNPGYCVANPTAACQWTPVAGGGSVDVSTPSATTEAMSAVLTALKFNHPSWTWGDVKSVLRTTASNWSTGYAAYNSQGPAYGYGNINYPAANTYTGPIYLQPPGMTVASAVSGNTHTYTITLYPFLQTRRVKEAVYLGGTWPDPATGCGGTTCNEYTAAQIAASGATLVCASNGTDVTPACTYSMSPELPVQTTTNTFVALTLDANGNGSRVESFMPWSETIRRVMSGQDVAKLVGAVYFPLLLQ